MLDRSPTICLARAAASLAVIVAAAILLVPTTAAAAGLGSCPGATLLAEDATSDQLESAMLCLMNKERLRKGIRPLEAQEQLRQASLKHTFDMLGALLFSHTGSNGSTLEERIKKTGYFRKTKEWFVGENLAYGYGYRSSPRAIMRMLMNSPVHRANILDKHFKEVGVGVAYGTPEKRYRNEGATYTTDFGGRR
jgi:uncharacterized protein YkwD